MMGILGNHLIKRIKFLYLNPKGTEEKRIKHESLGILGNQRFPTSISLNSITRSITSPNISSKFSAVFAEVS